MKKSKVVTLVLLTSTMFLGCERDVRNKYASWEDCAKDYTNKQCYEEQEKNTAGGYHVSYYGPWYRASSASDPRYNPSASSRRSIGVVRGGWGFSAGHGGS